MKSRFAPSPTGYLHIGSARTALFAWLWAKNKNAKFVLRIEDTDKQRSTQESINAIIEGLDWLGLDYDEGPIYQSKRLKRYQEIVNKLLADGNAYYCECSKERLENLRKQKIAKKEKPKYDGFCRKKGFKNGVIRFLNPDAGNVVFNDRVKGNIEIANKELDDLILLRSDGSPTYNLTVVVDDYDMDINCVIRGDDHINNTPKQINLYKALGWNAPDFAHLPMILGNDKSRLSKRHGAISVMAYRDEGFLAKALLNYIVRLGWSYNDKEVFSIKEMIKLFKLENINKAPASFNIDKLIWLNQLYIKQSETSEILENLQYHLDNLSIDLKNGPNIENVLDFLKQRSKNLVEMANSCIMFYKDFDSFDELCAKKQFNKESFIIIKTLYEKLLTLDNWQAEDINTIIQDICDEQKVGFAKVGQPFRLALSGDGKAGSVNICASLLGKDRTIARLKMAMNYINQIN